MHHLKVNLRISVGPRIIDYTDVAPSAPPIVTGAKNLIGETGEEGRREEKRREETRPGREETGKRRPGREETGERRDGNTIKQLPYTNHSPGSTG
jgi:hypothetical protein